MKERKLRLGSGMSRQQHQRGMQEKEISRDGLGLNFGNGIISYRTGGHAPLHLRTFLAQTAPETGNQAVEIARFGHIIWTTTMNNDKSSPRKLWAPNQVGRLMKGRQQTLERETKGKLQGTQVQGSNRSNLRQSFGDTGCWDGRHAHLLGTRRTIRQSCLFACTSRLNI